MRGWVYMAVIASLLIAYSIFALNDPYGVVECPKQNLPNGQDK